MKRTTPPIKNVAVLLVVLGGGYLVNISFTDRGWGEALRARENVLKQHLSTMRQGIDNYTTDKKHAPASLQDLVDARYLREIPVDPITRKKVWVLQFIPDSPASKTNFPQLDDVHSNSTKKASDGSSYNTW